MFSRINNLTFETVLPKQVFVIPRGEKEHEDLLYPR
jgi:hypothetical protein